MKKFYAFLIEKSIPLQLLLVFLFTMLAITLVVAWQIGWFELSEAIRGARHARSYVALGLRFIVIVSVIVTVMVGIGMAITYSAGAAFRRLHHPPAGRLQI